MIAVLVIYFMVHGQAKPHTIHLQIPGGTNACHYVRQQAIRQYIADPATHTQILVDCNEELVL